jgi:hypothetical protein
MNEYNDFKKMIKNNLDNETENMLNKELICTICYENKI